MQVNHFIRVNAVGSVVSGLSLQQRHTRPLDVKLQCGKPSAIDLSPIKVWVAVQTKENQPKRG